MERPQRWSRFSWTGSEVDERPFAIAAVKPRTGRKA
jgi:hypothetical protein